MSGKSIHIAWLGSLPLETGGAPGVVAELLEGLIARGHRIDCFFPAAKRELPARFAELDVNYVWGTSEWRWARWYNRSRIGAFATGLFSRARSSLRLQREVVRRHARDPYDVIYQNSTIESFGAPSRLAGQVPLVIRPDAHSAGELRCLLAERRLAFASQPRHVFFVAVGVMAVRSIVQRFRIRRADLLICISRVFRDHLVHDYGFPLGRTVVIPNPVRLERFGASDREVGDPPTVAVLGRVSVRKGLDDVIAVAKLLLERQVAVRIRVVGGPSLWSDYTRLLDDLPRENSEFVGRIQPAQIPQELAESDLLLQASKYEPFGLTVAEALAAGVPVVATSEVGAIENVDRSVLAEVRAGDVEGMADAITMMLERLNANPAELRTKARAEAERLFATDVVCEQISAALQRLVEPGADSQPSARPAGD